jgi:hypothetical protein
MKDGYLAPTTWHRLGYIESELPWLPIDQVMMLVLYYIVNLADDYVVSPSTIAFSTVIMMYIGTLPFQSSFLSLTILGTLSLECNHGQIWGHDGLFLHLHTRFWTSVLRDNANSHLILGEEHRPMLFLYIIRYIRKVAIRLHHKKSRPLLGNVSKVHRVLSGYSNHPTYSDLLSLPWVVCNEFSNLIYSVQAINESIWAKHKRSLSLSGKLLSV